ncbi:MAG: hypothetical protein M1817_004692 [Caeruleum heppii]|nr:MAG: hypothetical protein M1817_004692 [Caeruleum heppii]
MRMGPGELRELNDRAWSGDAGITLSPSIGRRASNCVTDVFKVNGSLDSSLKKNTAFIKRLRTAVTSSTLPTFLQDIRSLSLHKYLSEIISASYEGLCKLKSPGEVAAGVEVISALHQRFGSADFTSFLGWWVGRGLSTPDKAHLRGLTIEAKEKEEKERLGRQRILLKVVTELWLVGVLKSLDDVSRPEDAARGKETSTQNAGKIADAVTKSKDAQGGSRTDAEPFPLEVLKDLLGHDREHVNLPLVVLFVKSFSWDILGIDPAHPEVPKAVADDGRVAPVQDEEDTDGTEEGEATEPDVQIPPVCSPDMQQRFRNVLGRYFEDLKAHLVRDQKHLTSQARRNAEVYVRSGEIFEDRQANHERQAKALERLISNAQVLSDVLGRDMPDLKDRDESDMSVQAGIGLVKTGDYLRGQGDGAGIWEDEEERRFYENLIDLKERVPGILLEDGKRKKTDGDDKPAKKDDGTTEINGTGALEPTTKSSDTDAAETDDQSTTIANKSVGAQVDALLARLPELTTKDLIDQAAMDFCFLNSKASRNRLVKAIQEVPRGRSDLLPAYGRLVATLGKYLPDVSQGLVSYLDAEFRSLQRRKDKDFLGRIRTSNIRYLAELTKFGVVPEHVIFHCLKVCLDEFSRMNIEIISNLLENCGRYLLRNPETSPRMASFLETLQRKKSAQHLGQQEKMLIENAVYYVDPPARAAIQQKERNPVDQFVRKQIYLEMNKRNYAKVLKQIRKLHWEEPEVVHMLAKVFTKPAKVKHSNIHLLAVLAGALYRYHQDFVIGVIDDLLESVAVGLEQNDFRQNQRRVSEVKYLGELYNYKMVDSPIIFDAMYRIVTFGHEGGTPRPGRICPLDLPDDFFRIRLVCTLLETCGMCFDRGTAKKKLDFFLTFFQYYIFTKDPLPMDVDFLIHDAYSLTRPQWTLARDLEEAGKTFTEAIQQNYKGQDVDKAAEAEDSDEETSSDAGIDEDETKEIHGEEAASSGEDAETENDNEAPNSESDEEEIVVTRQEDQRDPEMDADFDRELAKVMAESLESRKLDRKHMFDVPLPMRRHHRETSQAQDEASVDGTLTPPDKMAFSLLTKKGNRQQARTVELPSDSSFAVAMKTQQQAEREEQRRIKNLVLNYDLRDEQTDGEEEFHYTIQPNNNAKIFQGLERHSSSPRMDKAGMTRSKQRARKLQLSDSDW